MSSEIVKPENIKTNVNGSNELSNKNESLDLDEIIPLTSAVPSEKEIQFLIQSWLKGKADILYGL